MGMHGRMGTWGSIHYFQIRRWLYGYSSEREKALGLL